MFRMLSIVFVIGLACSLNPGTVSAQNVPVRERIAGRGGYISSGKELYSSFRDGYNLELSFTERIVSDCFIEFRIGAIYMGDLLNSDIDSRFYAGYKKEMRILLFTLAPQYAFSIAERISAYVGAGAGIYTTSMLFDDGLRAGDISDQDLGGQVHGGMLFRITESLNVDLSFAAHVIKAGGASNSLFAILTGGGKNPVLLQGGIGLSLDLR